MFTPNICQQPFILTACICVLNCKPERLLVTVTPNISTENLCRPIRKILSPEILNLS